MYDTRTTHSREVSQEIEKVFGEKVFRPIIKRSIKFADATVAGQPILTYAGESELAQAYRELAGEI
jgi:chromosome partitioning protein